MALFNIYESVKRAVQDFVSPEVQRLVGELRALQAKIRRLDEKIDAKHNEVLAQIYRLDEKVDSLAGRMDLALKFHDRLARLEAKVGLGPPA